MEKLIAGNWRKFDSFAWFERPDDADNWAIWYHSHRDSDLMSQSNARIITREMSRFKKNAREEHHSHWAVGYIDGFAVRMKDAKGRPTKAGEKANELIERMDDYPLLDEDDYYSLIQEMIDNLSANDLYWIAKDNKIKTRAQTKRGLFRAIPYELLEEYVNS